MANRFSPETTVWNRMSSAGVTIDGDYDMMDWMGNRRHILLAAVTGSAIIATACGHRPATADAHLFFPTRHEQGGDMMEALYAGPLVVRDECVLIGRHGEYSLPIWWKGFTAEPDESGRVVVRDGDGAIVAIEDERFEMGGGFTAEFYPGEERRDVQVRGVEQWLGYPIPDRCLGPDVYGVWVVGDTDPLPAASSSFATS
jgi:hypothetical protein